MAWNKTGNIRGPGGLAGQRGSLWYSGLTDPTPVPEVHNHLDMYLNTSNGNVFQYSTNNSWFYMGNIKGAAAPKVFGALRWSGPTYNPVAHTFTRLRTVSDGRLVAYADAGNVARTDGNNPRLVAPVAGMYQLTAAQTWTAFNQPKGMGLGRDPNDGARLMDLWGDFNSVSHATLSVTRYLEAGATLYPWTYNGASTGMSARDRGFNSEYSITLLHPE